MKPIVHRTDAQNLDFQALVAELNLDLGNKYDNYETFYAPYNRIDTLQYCVVAYLDQQAVGCGALREKRAGTVELKRMYVSPQARRRGVGKTVLVALEQWGRELGMKRCILETGIKQPAAIRLYEQMGYRLIPCYGQYVNADESVCFEKTLVS